MRRSKKKPHKRTPEERRVLVYRERNLTLKAMGFNSYKAYLASDLWKGIRSAVLARQPDCHVCGKPANQVHHTVYRKKDIEGRDLRRLVSLCGGCHHRIEFRDRDHEKLNPAQANAKMKGIVTRTRKPTTPPTVDDRVATLTRQLDVARQRLAAAETRIGPAWEDAASLLRRVGFVDRFGSIKGAAKLAMSFDQRRMTTESGKVRRFVVASTELASATEAATTLTNELSAAERSNAAWRRHVRVIYTEFLVEQ